MERITVLTFRTLNYLLDFCILAVAFGIGLVVWWMRYTRTYDVAELASLDFRGLMIPFLMFYFTAFFYLAYAGAYRTSRLQSFAASVSFYARAVSLSIVLLAMCGLFVPFILISRTLLVATFAASLALLAAKEAALRTALRLLRERGAYVRRALIVGLDVELIERLFNESRRNDLLGIDIIGVLYPRLEPCPEEMKTQISVPVVGDLRDFIEIIDRYHPDMLILFGRDIETEIMEEALWICEERGLEAWIKLDLLDRVIYQAQLHSLEGIPFITMHSGPLSQPALLVKYSFDRVASLLLLIFFSPVILAAALAIRWTSPGPVFFRQRRAGINGRPFEVLKFRSMVAGAEDMKDLLQEQNEMEGPVFKIAEDPRITTVGRFLRKTSIDELPQLWNVLRGNMSLVGPRPLPVEEAEQLHGWHRRRLSMKPGITCIWQVAGRNEIREFDDWAQMDLEYIDNWSLWLDLVLLIQTVPVVLFGRGAS